MSCKSMLLQHNLVLGICMTCCQNEFLCLSCELVTAGAAPTSSLTRAPAEMSAARQNTESSDQHDECNDCEEACTQIAWPMIVRMNQMSMLSAMWLPWRQIAFVRQIVIFLEGSVFGSIINRTSCSFDQSQFLALIFIPHLIYMYGI